ncbi:DUF3077 domain-containing protein [Pseudomonas sp. ADAK18]|uniref:DUF6124 family protein n=1 Tax=Pseudomonas sp. ADAK18 TaxID=2730848 RepID=UPI001463467A|nr:DUF3077 domain-containing protein [Pseudomonas sp. ADAK18]QJI29711.1 DUF3077 domain-containing protein [Pseudomonas sp. ADAK18]
MTTPPDHLPRAPDEDELLFLYSSGAAQRALDYYLKEDVTGPAIDDTLFEVKNDVSDEEALVHASDLLRSAAATAYEAANSAQGNTRDLAFSVVYLIDMAKAMVERLLHVPARDNR